MSCGLGSHLETCLVAAQSWAAWVAGACWLCFPCVLVVWRKVLFGCSQGRDEGWKSLALFFTTGYSYK